MRPVSFAVQWTASVLVVAAACPQQVYFLQDPNVVDATGDAANLLSDVRRITSDVINWSSVAEMVSALDVGLEHGTAIVLSEQEMGSLLSWLSSAEVATLAHHVQDRGVHLISNIRNDQGLVNAVT
eukprot:5414680-Amphidinium_carterae.1